MANDEARFSFLPIMQADNNNNNDNIQGFHTPPARCVLSGYKRESSMKDYPTAYDLGELEQPLLGYTLAQQTSLSESLAYFPRAINLTQNATMPFDNANERLFQSNFESPPSQYMDGCGESHLVIKSPQIEILTDQEVEGKSDAQAKKRLVQNREAARKSRVRKKAYVLQLENSQMKLNQLEQELQKARQQAGRFASGKYSTNQGAVAFDSDYSLWLQEQEKKIESVRAAIQGEAGDMELKVLVDSVMSHYEELFQLKNTCAKADVFHLLSGMWKSPVERCFLWIGGHRPSAVLKILIPQIELMSEPQLLGIYNLQQSSQQAEDALSQGMETLHQTLAEALSGGNFSSYMEQMAAAMEKLGIFESFLWQADFLRQQILQQLQRILTTRQLARAFLSIHEYLSRLRALSSLWLARPLS